MDEYTLFKKILYNSASEQISLYKRSLTDLLEYGNTLGCCFVWEKSPEGWLFWRNVNKLLGLYDPSVFHKFLLKNIKREENFIDIALFL